MTFTLGGLRGPKEQMKRLSLFDGGWGKKSLSYVENVGDPHLDLMENALMKML